MLVNIAIILGSIMMSSTAHVLLKKGAMSTAEMTVSGQSLLMNVWVVATNPWVLAGMFLHVSALAVWMWALSRVDISFAYPFLAVGYVFVSLMAWQWLGENITLTRLSGMAIIIFGIIVLSRGG
jgi:multidrug transporter EmrE-like cation transporter